jgi:hypothetical protein
VPNTRQKTSNIFSIVSLPTDSVIVDHAVSLRVEVSLFVLSPGIEDRDEVEVELSTPTFYKLL